MAAGREEKLLKISEIAEKAKVLPSTIRHYTDIGLVKFAATTEGGHRLYDESITLSQMARIKLLSARGLSLPDIRNALGPDAKKRILVVDDEPEVGDLVKDILTPRHPFDVRVAMDGFTAGRMMLDVLPDLVILDLMLPGVNGFDVCKQIRADEALRATKILAVTGYDTAENIQKITAAGADATLAKPFDNKELVRAVGKLLDVVMTESAPAEVRLRVQLALFFLLMTGSVLAVGLITVWGGIRVVDGFSASLFDVERLSQVRNLQNLLSRENASLDIFHRTGDSKEWARLKSLHKVSAIRFKELVLFEWPRAADIRALSAEHDSFRTFLNLSPSGRAADFLSVRLGGVIIKVNDLELSLSEEVHQEQGTLRRLVFQGARFLFGFLAWELLLGFLFALSTFRSIHKALNGLQAGTLAFGQGRFDHRIPVSSADELGDLAKSFNEMAENIKHLEVKTVHMHRMSAVGQLAGGVAHEINNPLTGVLGQAQVLLEKLPADDPRRAHAEKIERAALRCRRIVRSLLDFSRQKETHFAVYDLHEAVDATLELCEPDFHGRRVTLLKNFSPLIPPMTGNVAQLQQVFLNLASNALHAMTNGGALTISTGLAAFVPLAGGDKVDGVEVSFQDTGVGIAPEHISHVFEPFFTTKEIGKGTGLGLSVSLGIVRNHGGDIQAESEGKGKGALFRVLLPLTPPAHITDLTAGGAPDAEAGSPGVRFNP